MTSYRWHVGDARKVLPTLEAGSVDLVLSSPPFLALRSYLPDDDPAKGDEIGSEATPGEFIDTLLDVVEACERVLAPHGSLVFELGDTFAGSGGAGGDYNDGGLRDGQARFDGSASRAFGTGAAPRPARNRFRTPSPDPRYPARGEGGGTGAGGDWPLNKSLCLIPEMFRFALAYGFNPLTGRETPRWRVRNVVRWVRPNPPVGALGDKLRPGTSDLLIACKASDRFFDLDAVRTPSEYDRPNLRGNGARAADAQVPGQKRNHSDHTTNPAGAPPLDWWNVVEVVVATMVEAGATSKEIGRRVAALGDETDWWEISARGYPGSHFATFPLELCPRPIKAMCPERVCMTCGEPSRRLTEAAEGYAENLGSSWADREDGRPKQQGTDRTHHAGQPIGKPHIKSADYRTTGWTDCGHDTWRAGVVLDPFAGSGTTLEAALGLGRSAVGIDLDPRNLDLAQQRLGMFPLVVGA